jgi:succinate dehydrogenase / fumarate reductase flavoprotein subunit
LLEHDVLIVGAGLAGLRAAIAASDAGADVALLSKVHPVRSHTCCAQGGINGALGDDDSWEAHMFDTVKGSDYLGDQDAIEVMTREAPRDLIALEHMGCPFSRNDDGTIAQRPFGGAGFPRTAYAADISGFVILHTLYEQCLKRGIKVYEEWFLTRLVVNDECAAGVVAIDIRDGRLHELGARAVIFATGPTSRVYEGSSNSVDCTGDGTAIAYRAGLPLMDLEFVQFHPTGLRNGVLVTEGCRGEGAVLVNADGERFMARYAPNKMELASRDVVSRAEAEELAAGRGVDGFILLDLRPIGPEKIRTRLLQVRELSMDIAGVDPCDEPIPVRPTPHYFMGGIKVDVDGRSPRLANFFAAGECSCVSVHGANRLGGNSLLDGLLFGRRAGEAGGGGGGGGGGAARAAPPPPPPALRDVQGEIGRLLERPDGERQAPLRRELQELMLRDVGIYRERAELQTAVAQIGVLKERYGRVRVDDKGRHFNTDLLQTLETGHLLDIAECIALGALNREESRGSHARRDFPERDDTSWLRHSVFTRTDDGPECSFAPVSITRFQPEQRSY